MNRAQRRSNWLASHRSHREASRNSAPAPRPSASALRLHINELVLHGFPSPSRYSIAESTKVQLTTLLTTLLTRGGVPTAFKTTGEQPFVDAGSFPLSANARPDAIGSLVANAIYRRTK